MSTQETKPEPRRPKLRLPFDNRREDAGEWAFDHRAGLCVTLIAYLLLAIAFVGAKIVVGGRPAAQGFYIDLQQLEQLAAEKERLEREVRRRQQQEPIDWKSIRNDVSNENAKLDESLRDDRGTNTAALNDAADAAQERLGVHPVEYRNIHIQLWNDKLQIPVRVALAGLSDIDLILGKSVVGNRRVFVGDSLRRWRGGGRDLRGGSGCRCGRRSGGQLRGAKCPRRPCRWPV